MSNNKTKDPLKELTDAEYCALKVLDKHLIKGGTAILNSVTIMYSCGTVAVSKPETPAIFQLTMCNIRTFLDITHSLPSRWELIK